MGVHEVPMSVSHNNRNQKLGLWRISKSWEEESGGRRRMHGMKLSRNKGNRRKPCGEGKVQGQQNPSWDAVVTLDSEPSLNEGRRNQRGTCKLGSRLL